MYKRDTERKGTQRWKEGGCKRNMEREGNGRRERKRVRRSGKGVGAGEKGSYLMQGMCVGVGVISECKEKGEDGGWRGRRMEGRK